MKILLIVLGGAGSRVSGPEIRGWEMARALGAHHEVTIAVHDPPAAERDGHRLIPFTRREVTREARGHDAVIAPVLPPYLFAALRNSSTITVADQYDPITMELSSFTDRPGVARELGSQRMIRDLQLRFADVIACAGEAQRGLLLEELGGVARRRAPEVVSVPFGLPAPPPPVPAGSHPLREHFPAIGPEDPVVLWWGKIWKWFDAESAIRAFSIVAAQRPNARLVISAGKAPKAGLESWATTEDARSLARDLDLLDRNVFFLDEWTPYDRRHEYLADADVGITMHAGTAEAPFAARARYLDYLWCGVPCVLASGDETAARFGEAGLAELVPPGDVPGCAEALLRLIDSPGRCAEAHRAGLALADDFRWPVLVDPLRQAIERRVHEGRDREASRTHVARRVGRYYARRTVDHATTLVNPR
jgi:glycosyltransferase involved in cell wall biosynthesis